MAVIHRNQNLINDANQARLSAAREKFVAEMNTMIGRVREQYITTLPGQDMIYQAKETEARRYLQEQPETLQDFPFIQAEVGVLAPTPELVAQTWIGMGDYWREIAAMLEGLRMTTSNAFQSAQSMTKMEQIMEIFREQLESIV